MQNSCQIYPTVHQTTTQFRLSTTYIVNYACLYMAVYSERTSREVFVKYTNELDRARNASYHGDNAMIMKNI